MTKRLTAERIGKIRGVLRVARTYASPAKGRRNGGHPWMELGGYSPRTWRRAYVETALTCRPAECVSRDGVTVLEVMGAPYAVATAGRVLGIQRLGTHPKAISALTLKVSETFYARVVERMAELEPDVSTTSGSAAFTSKALVAIKERWARPFVIGAMKRFLAAVDPEAVKLARRFWLVDPACLAWLTPSDPELAKRRRQAVELYPTLALNAEPWNHPDRPEAMGRAVDSGMPLVEVLAKARKVRPATIRWFAGKTPQSLFRRLAGATSKLPLVTLDLLPTTLLPKGRADMEAARRLERLFSVMGWGPGSEFDVRAFMKRIPASIPLSDQPVLSSEQHTQQVIDVIGNARTVCSETNDRFEQMGLSALDKLAKDWHRAVVVATSKASSGVEWPAALPGLDIAEGELRLVELTTGAQLMAEGVALAHCVGTYVNHCLRGASRIISVRDGMGMPLSTIEIRSDGSINQHCGYRNAAPGPAEAKLAKRLAAELRSGRLWMPDWPNLGGSWQPPSIDMADFWAARGFEVAARGFEVAERRPVAVMQDDPFPDEAIDF